MKRALALLATACVLGVSALACRQILPTNRFLQPRSSPLRQSTADARHKFDHAAHRATLAAAAIACGDCHRYDVAIEASEEDAARDLSQQALYPGSIACHTCHGPGDARMAAAPAACTTCHDNLAALRPADHDLAWSKVHASIARANPTRCENCHRDADCIDCHLRRDTIQTVVHERNYRFYHSIDARANPIQCGSCHREDFCIRCHQQGKVDLQP